MIDDTLQDEVRVTVIATGFDRIRKSRSTSAARRRSAGASGGSSDAPAPRERQESRDARRPGRDVQRSDLKSSSLEIPDDEIDIPPFLKD